MAKKGKFIYEYPHPAVTADCVVFGYDEKEIKVLLVKRGQEKEASKNAYVGEWALPGGFLKMLPDEEGPEDETIKHTAARELREETGLTLSPEEFKEMGTYSKKDRDPRERVITIAHYALVKLAEVKADTDADKAEWFSMSNIPDLAFDHRDILNETFASLKHTIHFEPVGFELLPEVFTLPQLQNLYESILGKPFDRRNFANKMKRLGLIQEVDDGTARHGTRTPIKYKFDKENYDRLKQSGFQLEF